MTKTILAILVAPWVETAKVYVLDLLVRLRLVEEPRRVGSTTKEHLTRFQGFGDLKVVKESLHIRVRSRLSVDFTGPNLDEIVAVIFQELNFL